MKKGWLMKTLGDLFDITSSKRVFEADWKREGVPFYRAREIVKLAKQGYVNNELFISEEMFNEYATKYGIPSPGDIMVTGVGTLGICYVVKEGDRFYFKDGNIIWLKKRSDADSRFIEYAFQSDYLREQIDDSIGATVGTYTIIKAKSTRIPVPPLPEQRRIVALLDEAFAGLATAQANAEKNLQNARALFESHLNEVFSKRGKGWVEKKLETCCEQIFAGGDVPKDRLSKERTSQYSVPIYSNGEKDDGLYGFTDSARVTKPSITVSARGTLGFAAIRTEPFLPVVRLIVLVPDEKQIRLSFLYYAVVGMDFGNTGTSIPQLTVPNFKESTLYVPALSEQEEIVERLDALSAETRRLAAIYERKLAALAALKKSLLHLAFAGGL